MHDLLAQAQPVVLVSIFKPLVVLALMLGWAKAVARLDQDMVYFYLARRSWNIVIIASGAVGFLLMVVIPVFFLALPLGLVVIIGSIAAYWNHRNTKVPEAERWVLSGDLLTQRFRKFSQQQAQKRASVKLMQKDNALIDVPAPGNPFHEAHRILEDLMEFCLPRAADQIDLTVDATSAAVVVYIDGVAHPREKIEAAIAMNLVDYLKHYSGLDVRDRRRKLRGRVRVDAGELNIHTLDIATQGSTKGVRMLIEIDKDDRLTLEFGELGLLDSQAAQFQPVLESLKRVVLVTAPPRHGMTTTLSSLVQRHDPYTMSVVTLEDQTAVEIEGVDHELIPPDADGETLANIVAAVMRRDPRVFMLSRLSDPSVATVLSSSDAVAESRVYVGMPAEDTLTALRKWIKAVGDPERAGQALAGILCQRLVRRLCPMCRVVYKPDPAMLKKMNLPVERITQLSKASGQILVRDKPQVCPNCHGLGYRGRIGVFEVMVLDDRGRSLIAEGQIEQLRAHLRKNKMLWLQEAGLSRAVEGATSVSEVTRAMGEGAGGRSSIGRTAAGRSAIGSGNGGRQSSGPKRGTK